MQELYCRLYWKLEAVCHAREGNFHSLRSQKRGVRAQAEGAAGKRISQGEFTEKAWQAVVSAPAMANRHSNQIVETEHMFKVLLEEPNGLARRIVSKAGSNASRLLDKTEAFIKQQGRTSGDSAQVGIFSVRLPSAQGSASRHEIKTSLFPSHISIESSIHCSDSKKHNLYL